MNRNCIGRKVVRVPCTVDIAQMTEQLHAHVVLEGVDIQPGDAVLVHEAPTYFTSGERRIVDSHATIVRAGWLTRVWTRLWGHFDLFTLCEVGFSSGRIDHPADRRRP